MIDGGGTGHARRLRGVGIEGISGDDLDAIVTPSGDGMGGVVVIVMSGHSIASCVIHRLRRA